MSQKSKILIVEDEFSIALDIKVSLEKVGYDVVGIAKSHEEAIQHTLDFNPNIVIMDVNISGDKNGIETANEIYQKYNIPIVFLTANEDDATFKEALASKPFGFLVKPFKVKELSYALQVALQKQEENRTNKGDVNFDRINSNILFIKDKSQLIRVKIDDILWVEAMDNYTQIHTKEKKIIVNLYLKEFYDKISKEKFLRVHRSYVIPIDKIDKIENRIIFIGDKQVPVSKAYKDELLKKIEIL